MDIHLLVHRKKAWVWPILIYVRDGLSVLVGGVHQISCSRAVALGAVVFAVDDVWKKNYIGGISMEKMVIVKKKKMPVKKEAIVAAKTANKHDFAAAMAAAWEQLYMSRYEFLAAMSTYMHDEARRDGVVEVNTNPDC